MTKYYYPWYLYTTQGQQVWRVIRRRVPRALAGGFPWLMVHEEMEVKGLFAGIQVGRIMTQVSVAARGCLGPRRSTGKET